MAALFKRNQFLLAVFISEEGGNAMPWEKCRDLAKAADEGKEGKKPQEEKPNHLLLVKSYKQLLQAQTERVPLYSQSLILFVHLVLFGPF